MFSWNSSNTNRRDTLVQIPRPNKNRASGLPTPSFSEDQMNFVDAVDAETYRPGYLGPTSFEAILPKHNDSPPFRNRVASHEPEGIHDRMCLQHPLTKSMRIQMATEVLKGLRNYRLIRDLVVLYYISCHAGIVAEPLVINAVNALKSTVDHYDLTSTAPSPELVTKILDNSTRPLKIPATIEACDFHTLFTGENLRLETLGFLMAVAGRSMMFGIIPENWNEELRKDYGGKFADEMLRLSTTCLVVCTLLTPVNDIVIWMFWENLQDTFMMCGYGGSPCWRRVGELATQIYALGIHREANSSDVPFFVQETRRKLVCAAFTIDKTISTFLGRPPRMSKRHIDINLPLDLSDEELCADPVTLEAARLALDANCWNTGKSYHRASWVRLRYRSSHFREEVLDFALAKLDDDAEQKLLDISRRSRAVWESHPQHMRYWSGCWEECPSTVCLMLVNIYLNHLYNDWLIYKLLDKQTLMQNEALLKNSVDMLSTALQLGQIRDRTYDFHRDFMYTILLYGIPSGSVLATALQEQLQSGQPFPSSISRSEIVRLLSVLISHLDIGSCNSGSSTANGNDSLCRKAAKTFTRVIDAVLDPKPVAPVEFEDINVDLDFFAGPPLEGFDNFNFNFMGDGGLYDTVDWTVAGQSTL
ncbi:hypothetical protein BDV96DRAFT_497104 [Lophiotrema nucula]|uniref:Xylanolytic transcriptional activator regulatory domain-containing protein n=1 Tax=Lophiotrema nucula TaxID=690887 RepID=A0A6A5Z0W8_9PLEO|nr:hypothetical protein BDV96DRAFT_497104 [Lophiotrema nucula]